MYLDIISFFVNYIEGPYFTLKTITIPLIFAIGFVEHEILKKKTSFQMNDLPQEFINYI